LKEEYIMGNSKDEFRKLMRRRDFLYLTDLGMAGMALGGISEPGDARTKSQHMGAEFALGSSTILRGSMPTRIKSFLMMPITVLCRVD
jgi:hypothetical protein